MSNRTELLVAYLRTLPNKVLYQDDDLSLKCPPYSFVLIINNNHQINTVLRPGALIRGDYRVLEVPGKWTPHLLLFQHERLEIVI